MSGYTSLMERDEKLALGLLETQNALLRSILRQYNGREVKTIGDAFLIEFDSAVEAVLCAIEFQSTLRTRNTNASADEQIFIRIGIHMGEVVFRSNDIFGDAVNIASRIQNFAEPGTICISEDVFNQIRNKINYPIEKIPNRRFKNVESEMDVYRIILPWEDQKQEAKFPVLQKNRIAVIPFANISPDPADSFFTDGLTEELIATLSEIGGLRVIARTSVMKYKGRDVAAAVIGRELSVPYILEGSVRKAGDRIRVYVQLIDCQNEEPMWSMRYERMVGDLFAIQSGIALNVASSLKITLLSPDRARVEKKGTENLTAYAAYLKGRTYLHERTEAAIRSAREQFIIATKEDPEYALAYAGLADTHMLLGDNLFAPVGESLELAKSYIDRALELDPDIAEARVSLAYYLTYDYKFKEAEAEFKRAIALSPSYATGHHWYANLLEHFGKAEESLAEILLAEQLDPLSSAITGSAIYACIQAGKSEEALKRIRKLSEIEANPAYVDEGSMTLHFAAKEWEKAMFYILRMKARDPDDPFLIADIGYINAVTGKKDEALKTIELLTGLPPNERLRCSMIAFVYSGLGDLDESFKWLERSIDEREVFVGWFRLYPTFENLRKDPRFEKFLERANLPIKGERLQKVAS